MEKQFEKATRNKVRFETNRGNITVEDLWDLPLTSKTGFSLDDIAKSFNRKLKESDEESFVTKSSSANELLKLKFELVKYVISVKLEENATAKINLENKEKKNKILSIIAQKQDEKLMGSSLEELQAMVNSL